MTASRVKRFSAPAAVRLKDVDAERVRIDTHLKIRELQKAVDPLGHGSYLGSQTFVASGTYTPSPGCTRARVRWTGGGGGGGIATGAATGVGVGAGGSAGVACEAVVGDGAALMTGGPITIGAGGPSGTNGGDTTVVIGGLTLTAKGGTAGGGVTASTTLQIATIGSMQAGTIAPTGAVIAWSPGTYGWTIQGSSEGGVGGNGGSGPFGQGGVGAQNTAAAGGNGGGYGAGGGGALCLTVTKAGGAGSAGVVIIDEWN